MDSKLVAAFKFHMRDSAARPRFWHALGQKGLAGLGKGIAVESLARARRDVAEGKSRYPNPHPLIGHGKGWKPESDGLRFVGRVVANCGGRNGESRFLAGYDFSDVDGGPTLDLSRVYSEPRNSWRGRAATDCDAARDAECAADGMAKRTAEEEREYQTAWQAGSRWNDLAEQISAARKEALEAIRQFKDARKAFKTNGTLPGNPEGQTLEQRFSRLCQLIKSDVSDLVQSIAESRAEQRKLAEGEYRDLYFWNGEQRLREAFMEGAGIDKFPA